jgi:competence protein ComEA
MRDRLEPMVSALIARVGFSRLIGTAIGVAVTAVGAWWVVRVPPPPVETTIPMATLVSSVLAPLVMESTVLVVHVAGEVVSPGVYELPAGSRLIDALNAAGGPTRRADTDAINLATMVSDAQQVFVPRKGVAVRREPTAPRGTNVAEEKVNVNTATSTELETLPGVGPHTAQAIIDHRAKNGPFLAVEELMDVRGIGPATLERLRDRVRL